MTERPRCRSGASVVRTEMFVIVPLVASMTRAIWGPVVIGTSYRPIRNPRRKCKASASRVTDEVLARCGLVAGGGAGGGEVGRVDRPASGHRRGCTGARVRMLTNWSEGRYLAFCGAP